MFRTIVLLNLFLLPAPLVLLMIIALVNLQRSKIKSHCDISNAYPNVVFSIIINDCTMH